MEEVPAYDRAPFDFGHLNDPVFQFQSRGLETVRLNLMHAYSHQTVEGALKTNDLWRDLNSMRDREPIGATSRACMNALERVRQLQYPSTTTYMRVLDTARSALKEIILWFRKSGQQEGEEVTTLNKKMENLVLESVNREAQILSKLYMRVFKVVEIKKFETLPGRGGTSKPDNDGERILAVVNGFRNLIQKLDERNTKAEHILQLMNPNSTLDHIANWICAFQGLYTKHYPTNVMWNVYTKFPPHVVRELC